jgi:hypothetical protein
VGIGIVASASSGFYRNKIARWRSGRAGLPLATP